MTATTKSYWLKSGSFTLLQRASVVLFGFVGFFILVRILSVESYGTWMLFLSVTTFLEVLRNGFLRNPTVKFINTSTPDEAAEIVRASLVLNIIISIVFTVVLLLIGPWLSTIWDAPILTELLNIYAFTNLLLIPFSHFEYIQQAHFSFKGLFFSYFGRAIILMLVILVAFLIDYPIGLVDLAYAYTLSILGGAVIAAFFAHKYWAMKTLKNSWMKELFHFGKYTFSTNIASTFMSNIDQWMLGSLISPLAVGLYNPAIRIANLVEVPSMSISTVLFPHAAKSFHTNGKKGMKDLYERSVGIILALILPFTIFVFFFSDEIVLLIAGDKYAQTGNVLRVTILYTLLVPFARQFGTIVDASGQPKLNTLYVSCMVVVNIISNYFFIRSFGVIGAAYGTLLSFSIGLVINQIILKHLFDVHFFGVIKKIFSAYGELFSMVSNRLKR